MCELPLGPHGVEEVEGDGGRRVEGGWWGGIRPGGRLGPPRWTPGRVSSSPTGRDLVPGARSATAAAPSCASKYP